MASLFLIHILLHIQTEPRIDCAAQCVPKPARQVICFFLHNSPVCLLWLRLMCVLVSRLQWTFYRPQRSCGKVMFSQASVILSMGGRAWQWGMHGGGGGWRVCDEGVCMVGGVWQERRPLQRTVRILLGGIFVFLIMLPLPAVAACFLFLLICIPWTRLLIVYPFWYYVIPTLDLPK